MNENSKVFLGKKRNAESPIESNEKTHNNIIINNDKKNKEKEIITLNYHSHWVNKILILKKQPNHNLISSSADGLIIVYDNYPKYNPVLKMALFGESGVIDLTELKDGTIIACSFAAIKQIIIIYDKINNSYNYEVMNYIVICSSYISKCIELINEDLLCISQQNIIIILKKFKEDENVLNNGYTYKIKETIELLKNELCINILQITEQLFISCHITNPKYDLSEYKTSTNNLNCIKFYDNNFNYIKRISKIYATKWQNNMMKLNEKYVIVGVEVCTSDINWNNKKGIALINYNYLEFVSFYETDYQISSMTFYDNNLFFGDDKGFLLKYKLDEQEIILQNKKRIHLYNISTLEYDLIFDLELKKINFILLTGSNDQTIKISNDL